MKLDDPGDGFLSPAQVKALADKQGGFGLQIRKKPTVGKGPSSNLRTTTTTTSHLVKTDEQIRSEAERKVELEMRKILSGGFGQDEFDEDKEVNAKEKEEDDNWTVPTDQRGDGKTRLNEKLGY